MQMQGLMFVILLVAIPVMLLFANQTVFFIVTGLVLAIVSLKDLEAALLLKRKSPEELDEDFIEEIEDTMNVDVKKIGTGINVMKSCLAIVFYVYCTFFVNFFAVKVLITLLILYKVKLIVKKVHSEKNTADFSNIPSRLAFIASSTGTLLLVLITTCNKFIRVIL